jgi:hypothetical protein
MELVYFGPVGISADQATLEASKPTIKHIADVNSHALFILVPSFQTRLTILATKLKYLLRDNPGAPGSLYCLLFCLYLAIAASAGNLQA